MDFNLKGKMYPVMQESMANAMGSHTHRTIIRTFIPANFQYYPKIFFWCPASIGWNFIGSSRVYANPMVHWAHGVFMCKMVQC